MMSGPDGGVKVTLGGETRTLRYDNRALWELEEATGLTIGELGEQLQRGSFQAVSYLVWAGLLHEAGGLSVHDVVDVIDFGDLQDVAEKASDALAKALGVDDLDEAEPEGEAKKKAT